MVIMKPLDPGVSMACMITKLQKVKKKNKVPFDGGGVGSGAGSPV